MNQTSKFDQLSAAKRSWEVMEVGSLEPIPGAYDTIQKGLALRHLEIPVGSFIEEVGRKEKHKLSDSGMALLKGNIKDEEKHDRQLGLAFDRIKDQPGFSWEAELEGRAICLDWIALSHKYHPILVALCAENSVFFPLLALFRRLGGVGLANISNEINRDEIIHVATNRYIAFDLLGLEVPKEIDELREATINWLVEKLPDAGIPGKYGRASSYSNASRDLLYKGTYNQFGDTRKAQFLSFFEISADNLPIYS